MSPNSVRIAWAILTLAVASPVGAGQLQLAWDAAAGAKGYRLYYGTSPEALDHVRDVGTSTSVTVDGLTNCATSHFAVTAYNAAGESAPSNPLASWPRPAIDQVTPGQTIQGNQLTLVIRGLNFGPGAELSIDNPHVHVGPAGGVCDTLSSAITVEPRAENARPARAGPAVLRVRNVEGATGLAPRAFEVVINAARFDVNRSDPTTDGRLDGWDTVWIARLFGSREGDAYYDPRFDFDGDGWVDGEELAWLGSNLGRCWSGTAWTSAACPQAPRTAS